jgi:enamine deaminase RidA (YjgF/YER057c/UK114 family)
VRIERRLVPAISPFAASMGYSRAVAAGPNVFVAGTAPIMPGDADPPADGYGQMRRCLEIILEALAALGAGPEHVVRTRLYLTRPEAMDGAARAHGEVFGGVRPVNTTVVIAGLLDPRWLLELEVDAVL